MPKLRCQCKNITNNLVCKNKSNNLFYFNNLRYCYIHFIYWKNKYKYASLIQNFYKSYKIRQKFKKIYSKIPNDLQHLVKFYIHEKFYIEKYNQKIALIVNNKLEKYLKDFDSIQALDNINNPFLIMNYLSDQNKYIYHLFTLFKKYNSILINKYNLYYNLISNINKINYILICYEPIIFNHRHNHMFIVINTLHQNLKKILN